MTISLKVPYYDSLVAFSVSLYCWLHCLTTSDCPWETSTSLIIHSCQQKSAFLLMNLSLTLTRCTFYGSPKYYPSHYHQRHPIPCSSRSAIPFHNVGVTMSSLQKWLHCKNPLQKARNVSSSHLTKPRVHYTVHFIQVWYLPWFFYTWTTKCTNGVVIREQARNVILFSLDQALDTLYPFIQVCYLPCF